MQDLVYVYAEEKELAERMDLKIPRNNTLSRALNLIQIKRSDSHTNSGKSLIPLGKHGQQNFVGKNTAESGGGAGGGQTMWA